MGVYRTSRAIEASFIDYLKPLLLADWGFDRVEKTFAKIYTITLPSICIRTPLADHNKVEIGSDSTVRTSQVLIDIFATDDGLKLDLKDYIIEKIKNGLIYYNYEIEAGVVKTKTADGRIRVLTIDETPINLDVEKSDIINEHDKFRHLLTLTISLGKVEE